ncbi:hypothetical protein CTAYLR_006124 [Chrysophaeum taylorii]|uniref:Peptide-methionine (S)-S-oxide reductase n=1 Tax=Chrysophaeum taylorii TaxID=2483200 RepID=A0AAD7XRQ2_9STRA|nr:hypothetical protein CTAYLR_006124 [Chrysophaeum taylorii]
MWWVLFLETASSVSVYFGNGCFWARQHMFVEFEQSTLGRDVSQLTAITAYAGNKNQSATPLCYYNANKTHQYADAGAAEVVSLELDDADVQAAATVYFESFISLAPGVWARDDYYDVGAGYRALVGLPGGLDGPYADALYAANVHNMTLVSGTGSEPDTLGTNTVYVEDADLLPAAQAEISMQFHDDQQVAYPATYHNLTFALFASGRLQPNASSSQCPPPLADIRDIRR